MQCQRRWTKSGCSDIVCGNRFGRLLDSDLVLCTFYCHSWWVHWCLCEFADCSIAKMRRVTLAVHVVGFWCEIVKFSCSFSSFIMMLHFNLRKILRHFWCNRNKTTAHSLRAPLTQIHSIFYFYFREFCLFFNRESNRKEKEMYMWMLKRNANSWKRRKRIKKIVKKFCNFLFVFLSDSNKVLIEEKREREKRITEWKTFTLNNK